MIGDFIGEMVPIFFLIMIVAIVVGPVWINGYFRARERQQLHETLRTAYEKGQPPPPELIEKLTVGNAVPMSPDQGDRDLRRAVVLIAVGFGMALLGLGLGYGISLSSEVGGWVVGGSIAGSGAIPGMIGVAYLLLYVMKRSGQRV